MFGRNRESRNREAAGRRNWPEAVPRKMRSRKRRTEISEGVGLSRSTLRTADGKVRGIVKRYTISPTSNSRSKINEN
jgi:hypothetical protein